MRTAVLLHRLRRGALLVVTLLIVLRAGQFTFMNYAALRRDADPEDWFEAQQRRLMPAKLALPTDVVYRLVLVDPPADGGASALRKGITEYIFAPVVVDVASDSSLLVIDANRDAALDTWLRQQEGLTVLERFGGGVALVREER